MREINKIIIHCTDTPSKMDVGVEEINHWHKDRGFTPYAGTTFCGYHKVIRRDGVTEIARPEDVPGIHCAGHNSSSLAICLAGRVEFTSQQMRTLVEEVIAWMVTFNLEVNDVYGHYEFDQHGKTCPNIDMDQFRSHIAVELQARSTR